MLLSLDSVTKRYQLGETTINAISDINIEIHTGEFVAIMGPSGSGKSTLLQVASLLGHPTDGTIVFQNTDVSDYTERQRAALRNKEIGFIFQQFNLLPRTSALDNVALPLVYANVDADERHARAQKMLEKVGLGDRLKNTPAQLSGGQQQRVAIARALVNNPSVVFADEPTGNLDSRSGQAVKEILQELHADGTTVIMVTHEQLDASISERLILLRDGKLAHDGSVSGFKDVKKIWDKHVAAIRDSHDLEQNNEDSDDSKDEKS